MPGGLGGGKDRIFMSGLQFHTQDPVPPSPVQKSKFSLLDTDCSKSALVTKASEFTHRCNDIIQTVPSSVDCCEC